MAIHVNTTQSPTPAASGMELPDGHEQFTEWLAREMPAGTVIGDPRWWAPKIIQAFHDYRSIAQAALTAQPAPGVGGDARDGFDLVDDLVIATMSMCAGQAGEHAAAECKAEIIRRLVRLSELEASVAQPAPGEVD